MKAILTTLFTLALTVSAFAGKSGWDDDYAKSLKKAEADNKLVLLDFTGSDWCGWCMKLDSEVFSKSAFKTYAKDKLVLVELDYPQAKHLPKKVQEQNAKLKTQFGVSGFPTIVLLDATGKELARWGGYSAKFFDELKARMPAGKESAAAK